MNKDDDLNSKKWLKMLFLRRGGGGYTRIPKKDGQALL